MTVVQYLVRGLDGQVYGPVAESELREWIAEDRVDADTEVSTDDGTTWVLAGTLSSLFASPAAARIAIPGPAPASAPINYNDPLAHPGPVNPTPSAVRARQPVISTKPTARAPFVAAAAVVLVSAAIAATISVMNYQARQARESTAQTGMTALANGMRDYLAQNENRFPEDMGDASALAERIKATLTPPAQYPAPSLFTSLNPSGGEIVPNPSLAGRRLSDIAKPDETGMFVDRNPWPKGYLVAYVSGRVTFIPQKQFDAAFAVP